MKLVFCCLSLLLLTVSCTPTVPDLPVRETIVPVTVAVLVDGQSMRGNPNSGFMQRIRNDITRTRMAVAVEPGEPSKLLLHVTLRSTPAPMRVSWVLTDHRENIIQRGWRHDALLGTGLTEQMVSSIVLHHFAKVDLAPFTNTSEIVFIRDGIKVGEVQTEKPRLRSFPKSETLSNDDYAVVVGIEKYRGEFEPVAHAENDAIQFAEMLRRTFNLPAENIKTLINDRATKSDIVAAIYEWLPKHATAKGRVFVFFSGYGSPNHQAEKHKNFLLPFDGTPSYLATGGISIDDLEAHLGALESKNAYLFLDTSFSGTGLKSLSPKGIRPLIPQKAVQTSPVFIFSGTTKGENAQIFDEQKHGVFTHFLLSGLSGDADENADKSIEISELQRYLGNAMTVHSGEKNTEQTPAFRSPADAKLETNLVNKLNISGR